MARLDEHLERLESDVTARGGVVHWARDANEANAHRHRLVRATGETEVVKVKSMATQEIGLNEALEAAGIAAYETDLAELIVQLGHDLPSHILVPAIHRNRAEIREIFLREMADVDPRPHRRAAAAGDGGPGAPAQAVPARKVAISGANFGDRGDRDAAGGRVRGQRPDVPDAARDPDHRHGHREGAADLAGPRGVPAAAAALVDRRADEPLHLGVDRASPPATGRRSSTSCCSTTAAPARWPTRSGATRCTASGARPA